MAKVSFTAGRIESFQCPNDRAQAFLWCDGVPGLAVRATAGSDRKRFIFQAKVNRKSMRVTIGDVKVWSIEAAQAEARRLQVQIDQGNDPRQVKIEVAASKHAKAAAMKQQEARETVLVGKAWDEYVATMKTTWGALHLRDHERAMHLGGEKRKRSSGLTQPGALASLSTVRLIDLTPERVIAWAKVEAAKRPGRARNARTLLSTFLNWCATHPIYGVIVTINAAQSKEARRHLGKPKQKNDCLQREQLPVWFAAVKQISNPVISAYLQILLLIGSRTSELIELRWENVDFKWSSITIKDKNDGLRIIPLTPYVTTLLLDVLRQNNTPPNARQLKKLEAKQEQWRPSPWVFYSRTAVGGHLVEPRIAHDKACAVAAVDVTLHGLRRSFATLSEWIEMPAGIGAQIQGHKPQGVREQHYIRRPLDLLRMWHEKIEAWILEQGGIKFVPVQAGLRLVHDQE